MHEGGVVRCRRAADAQQEKLVDPVVDKEIHEEEDVADGEEKKANEKSNLDHVDTISFGAHLQSIWPLWDPFSLGFIGSLLGPIFVSHAFQWT